MKADLHVHTRLSDGQHTPEEIFAMAAACGVTHLALTDHDLLQDVKPFAEAAKKAGICLIPGIELSALLSCGSEIHLLGYGIDSSNTALAKICEEMLCARRHRFEKMLRRLQDQGLHIGPEDISLGERGLASRMHLAYALVKKGYVGTPAQAMEAFLTPGRPAYIPNEALDLKTAAALIKGAGGAAVLAHPFRYRLPVEQTELLLQACREQGAIGAEVFYPTHTSQQRKELLRWCKRLSLLPTGGTDFHKGSTEDYRQRLENAACCAPKQNEALEQFLKHKVIE